MTVFDPYWMKLDGLTLADGRYMIEQVPGMNVIAQKRGGPVQTAYRHGSYDTEGEGLFFDEKTQTFMVTVFGTDADGQVTHPAGWFGHLEANKDALFAVLGKRGRIDVRRIVPGTIDEEPEESATDVELQNFARVRRSIEVGGEGGTWQVLVELVYPWPFWRELPLIQRAAATSHEILVGGTAPVADMVLTFAGDGTATWTEAGFPITIEGSGGAVTVDMRAREVREGSTLAMDLLVLGSGTPEWWWEWPAQTEVNLTSTVNVAVDYYNARH